MTALTPANLALLRQQPHRTDLYLSIYRPNVLMTAQVTGTYSTGDRQITYYNSSGTYLNLYPDLTAKIGSTPGAEDIGRLRIRSATGTYINFAENSVTWNTGMYLTLLDYIDVQAIYPRIIQDPSNATNVIFYKDFDVPYSNQNSIYGTIPNAGPHRALFLASGTATTYYTASGTYNVASQSLTYSWNFDGGSPTGSTALTPGNVTYSQPGHYKTRLRITAANGAVDDTYRYVSVYNRPGEGSSTPTLRWELQDMSGSRDSGGYAATIRLHENIGEIEPNALVILFSDTWYGGTKQNIGGNSPNNSSIVFVGYVLSDSISFSYDKSWVEFQIGSVSEVMKSAEGFSVSCESKASPTTWFELAEMTVPKAMYHYMRWHSTVLKTTDFHYTGDDRLVQYFDADRGSLYDAVDSFMRDGMLGSVVSDRQGKLWAEINPWGLQTPFDSIPENFTVHKQDWIGSPNIQERRTSEVSFIELGGIAYYGVTTNTWSALLSNAPSTVPLYRGRSDSPTEGLILVSQEQLNQVAGNYLAHQNTKFPNVNLSMAGTYLNLDIAPLEQMRLVIDQNDSVRGKSIQDLRYIVSGMEWSYNARDEVFKPEVTLTQIATGTLAQTVLIPAVAPDDGYKYPTINLPPLPGLGGTTPVGPTTATRVVIHDTTAGFLYTTNFDSGSPQWQSFNGGLTLAQYQAANRFIITPNGACYCAYADVDASATAGMFVARAPYLGGMWTILYSNANLTSGLTARWGVYGIGCRYDQPETIGIVMAAQSDTIPKFYLGASTSFAVGANVTAAGYAFLFDVSYGDNKWMCTSFGNQTNGKIRTLPSNASSVTVETTPSDMAVRHVRAGVTGKTFHQVGTSTYELYLGDNNSATMTGVDLAQNVSFDDGFSTTPTYFDVDGTGQYMMSRGGASVGNKGRSSDYGYSWMTIPNLPPGNYWFANAGTSQSWLAAGGSTIRSSPNFGETWIGKEGNIVSLVLTHINMIKYAGNT